MQEVKKPRKPLIYYYAIVLAVLLLFNFLLMPWAAERQVQEVGYDTFIEMTEKEEIGQVQINQEDNEVIFTNKDGDKIYKTGMVEDPGMTERLYASGAKFSGQIIEQATKLARSMITRYGMSKDFDMVAMETVNNQYLGGDTSLSCSAETQAEIDRQVVELVKKQHEKAAKILADNREKLDQLADYLYDRETITGEEFMNILNAA